MAQRCRDTVSRPPQPGRNRDDGQPIVSGDSIGVREVPPSPIRAMEPKRFLSVRGVLCQGRPQGEGLSPPISGGEEIVFTSTKGDVKHPLTGETMTPTALFGDTPDDRSIDADPRESLADWMTSIRERLLCQGASQSCLGELMGRGLVEPVDDLRSTNPPTNPGIARCTRRRLSSVRVTT